MKNKTLDSFVKKSNKKELQEEQEEQKEEQLPQNQMNQDFPTYDEFVDQLDTWKPYLQGFKQLKTIYDFAKQEYSSKKCYPPPELIFNCFQKTTIDNIKVVIVGQDPYINEGEAMGMCFSVPEGIKVPPSLVNIYKLLKTDIEGFQIPKHGNLTKWAEQDQGVFLLNTVLTVEAKKSNSHKGCGWLQFTDEVIKVIDKECNGVVFLLWGKPAQAIGKKVNRNKHFILETVHPSPLSARNGFFDSNHFSKCNKLLRDNEKEEIDWQV